MASFQLFKELGVSEGSIIMIAIDSIIEGSKDEFKEFGIDNIKALGKWEDILDGMRLALYDLV